MPPRLLTLFGALIIAVALWGLVRGLRSNYYYKDGNPFSFYGFILIYLSLGSFLLYQSLR